MDIASSSTTNQLSVGKKIISIIMDDKKVEINSEVFHIDNYDVSNSRDMKEGIYIVNQFNLDDEAIKFIRLFQEVPRTKSKKSSIIEIKFEVGLIHQQKDQKYVIICIDATHSERFNHSQLKNVADTNGIKYINENIGNVILSVIDSSCKEDRKTFTDR